jgi:hypothetical protein
MKTCLLMIFVMLMKFNYGQQIPAFNTRDELVKLSGELDLEVLGKWHNEYLDHVYQAVKESGASYTDEQFYKVVNQASEEFFAERGIQLNENVFQENDLPGCIKLIDLLDVCKLPNVPEWYRKQFCKFKKLMDAYSESSLSREELDRELDNLAKEEEKEGKEANAIRAAVTVAKYSLDYWTEKAKDYARELPEISGTEPDVRVFRMDTDDPGQSGRAIIGKMGTADAMGAATGALFGGLGAGPVGAFAGALVGAGTRSVMRGLFFGFTGR